jgi:uncharacterized protein (DUF433 family)
MNTEHIWTDPKRCGGRPCIRGHRLTLGWLLSHLAEYGSIQALCADFGGLTEDKVRGVLRDLSWEYEAYPDGTVDVWDDDTNQPMTTTPAEVRGDARWAEPQRKDGE